MRTKTWVQVKRSLRAYVCGCDVSLGGTALSVGMAVLRVVSNVSNVQSCSRLSGIGGCMQVLAAEEL